MKYLLIEGYCSYLQYNDSKHSQSKLLVVSVIKVIRLIVNSKLRVTMKTTEERKWQRFHIFFIADCFF